MSELDKAMRQALVVAFTEQLLEIIKGVPANMRIDVVATFNKILIEARKL